MSPACLALVFGAIAMPPSPAPDHVPGSCNETAANSRAAPADAIGQLDLYPTLVWVEDGTMPEPLPSPSPSVFQLRVVLGGISPLIWRRLVLDASSTLDELHHVLQVAFAWSGDHLHRFKIHGREYGASAPVALGRLGLRPSERFIYDYDFGDLWRHDIRVEQIMAAEGGGVLPRCTGGRRAGPPEDSGGPLAFMELTQPHRLFAVARRVGEILSEIVEGSATVEDHRAELVCLRPWLLTERFDRRALNRSLAGLSPKLRAA